MARIVMASRMVSNQEEGPSSGESSSIKSSDAEITSQNIERMRSSYQKRAPQFDVSIAGPLRELDKVYREESKIERGTKK